MIFMNKPSHEHKEEQYIPSIEALDPGDGAAQVRMRYDSHEDDQPTKRLIPVPEGIDGKECYDKREDRIPYQFISPVFMRARIGRLIKKRSSVNHLLNQACLDILAGLSFDCAVSFSSMDGSSFISVLSNNRARDLRL